MTVDSPKPLLSRIRPSIIASIGLWFAYTLVFYGLAALTGIPYADWFKTAGNALYTAVIPLAAGSALLVAFTRYSHWNYLWRDPVRFKTTAVMKVAMILWVVTIAVRLVGIRWSEVPSDLLAAILAAGIGVGFAEETLFRGIFLRGMREGGRSEATAAIWSSVCFGLFHLPNLFLGTGLFGVVQLILAALSGIVLYVFRRQWGCLWPAMIAHGTWDISTFLAGGYSSAWLSALALPLVGVSALMGILVYTSILLNDRRTIAIPSAKL